MQSRKNVGRFLAPFPTGIVNVPPHNESGGAVAGMPSVHGVRKKRERHFNGRQAKISFVDESWKRKRNTRANAMIAAVLWSFTK
jgi:hypothetical protein